MKKLLLALCFPLSAFAQTETIQPARHNNWEAGVNFKACLVTKEAYTHSMNLGGMNILSCYRNCGNIQVGAAFEYNLASYINNGRIAQFTTYMMLNRTFNLKRSYFYTGGMYGYTKVSYGKTNGFTTGLQAGGVYRLGQYLGLNLETGVRCEQLWASYTSEHGIAYKDNYLNIYFPVSAGIRFSF